MKTFIIPTPTPYQRAAAWAFNSIWDVFGDYEPHLIDWHLEVSEDGQVRAHDYHHGDVREIGTWRVNSDDELVIELTNIPSR